MIVLREFKQEDVFLLQDHLNNPQVTQYLTSSIPQPYTLDDAKWWINEGCKGGIVRAIEYNGQLVGSVGANRRQFEQARTGEIGYWIAQSYWGKGIATAALIELTAHILQTSDILRVQAHVFAGNLASNRVLEKAGYSLEGVLRKAVCKQGVIMDAFLYAIVRAENP